jgi:hypothetical protein
MEEAGQKLKRVRERLRLKFREVEEFSTRIAQARGSDEYIIALSRLADIENKGTLPTLFRLYSLCAIYRLEMTEVLGWYGVVLSDLPRDSALASIPATHLADFNLKEGEVLLPVSLDPGIDMSKTVFLSRFIHRWGKMPLMFLDHLDLKNQKYGFVGTEDWSMYPVISPGSFVVVDESQRQIAPVQWASEYDRPIYFLEHRGGYACSWCSLHNGRLILQTHPASGCDPEIYDYPEEIEIIGLVTQVAQTLYAGREKR